MTGGGGDAIIHGEGATRGMEEIDGPETKLFPEQFVHTGYRLEADDEERARQILFGVPSRPNRALPQYGSVPSGLFGE